MGGYVSERSVEMRESKRSVSDMFHHIGVDQGNTSDFGFWADMFAILGICYYRNGSLNKAECHFTMRSVEILEHHQECTIFSGFNLPLHLYFLLYAEFMHFGARDL